MTALALTWLAILTVREWVERAHSAPTWRRGWRRG